MLAFFLRSFSVLRHSTSHHVLRLMLLLWPLVLTAPLGADPCSPDAETRLLVTGRHEVGSLAGSEERAFTFIADRPGELWIEVDAGSGHPWLDPSGTTETVCSAAGGVTALRLPRRLMIEVGEPAEISWTVGSQDRRQTLDDIVLHVLFRDLASTLVAKDGTGDEGDEEEERPVEIIPIPSIVDSGSGCQALLDDDVADALLCARALVEGKVDGQITRVAGFDRDVYSFSLEERSWAALEAGGEVDTVLYLYNEQGLLVASNDDGVGASANVSARDRGSRLVRVLPAGRYFIAVEGFAGSEGAYRLSFLTELR